MKKSLATALFIVVSFFLNAQQINPLILKDDFQNQKKWVDSIYSNMSLQEKVGQLFVASSLSTDPKEKTDEVKKLIEDYYVGGVIFMKGQPYKQAQLTNEYQAASRIPLMISMDAEWGLSMRLDSTYAFPWNMTLGAITDNTIVEKVGQRIGEHAKRLGVHMNYAPVVDVNTNPRNPIIGNRSFGEDKENVAEKALAFLKGMRKAGVLGSAKHFPGHGDTEDDSHKTLPTISFSKERLDSIELYPYKKLIDHGLSSVMVAHLNIPSLEAKFGYPSSISKAIVTDLLKGELGFNGLIFTDALNMKGASNFKEPGEIDLAAFLAGNDILLMSEDVPKAHQLIVDKYREGVITEERLEHSVKKILYAKYMVGLNDYQPVDLAYLHDELNSVLDDVLYEEAMENALTVVKNENALLPLKNLETQNIAYINMGDDDGTPFLQQLQKYAQIDWVKANTLDEYIEKLKTYTAVIIGFHKSNEHPWKPYEFSENELVWLYEIARTNKVILDVFARPYALLDLKSTTNFESVIVSYQNSEMAQQLSAQVIFGARGASGKLPVTAGPDFPVNTQYITKPLRRLQYGIPESVGMNSYKLKKIDTLARSGVWGSMMPGAQILVARKGKVIYNKNFGHHTQSNETNVSDDDIYDVASLTKILATLPLVMQLVDSGEISLRTTLGEMLPEYKESNKGDIRLIDLLSHYAKLKAWIPFYIPTLDAATRRPSPAYYATDFSEKYSLKVAENLYMRTDYKDSIYDIIKMSDLRPKKEYRYSDLPFYILKKYLEEFYGSPLDDLAHNQLYAPLGANYTTYNPLRRFSKAKIVPTEEDHSFRMQTIQGYVHDQGAAMMGGVSGHAGLFTNANDVAKIMQMYLWKGFYGGKRFFKPETLDKFNTCYYCDEDVRRGVGFDKPQLGEVGPTCGCVSMTSFGHSGFTGTFAWADPEEEIVYVFLSNRTYPDATNRKLISSDLRSKIQEAIYEAIDVHN